MSSHLRRSIDKPIRAGLSYEELWRGTDQSLIICWESGRQLRERDANLAVRAANGELVPLPWKGGIDDDDKLPANPNGAIKYGVLKYLAMWQGLRGIDLSIEINSETTIVCSRTKRSVTYR